MTTKVEVGFELTANLTNFFHLNDPVKGKLNNPDYRLAGPIWIDITDDVVSVNIQRGKNRELDRYSASTASVVLNNQTRVYDPLNLSSPYVGNIIPRRAIRISTAGYPQFNGVIEDWNLDYDVNGRSTASISAADAFTLFAGQTLTAGTATAQTTGARINAILSQPSVAWPLDRRDIDSGAQYVGADVWKSSDNALSYLQTVADSEQGQFFMDTKGNLRFINGTVSPSQGNLVTVATNLMPNPSFETYSGGDAEIRLNLCPNPNFETSAATWTLLGSTITRDTVTKYAGAASLKVVTTGAATGQGTYSDASNLGYDTGLKFSVSAYVNAPAGATMEIVAASTGAGASNVTATFTGTGAWQLVKAEGATTGANASQYMVIRTRSTAQAITFYVDNALVQFGTVVGSYFDGSSTGTDGVYYSWYGTANLSSSYEAAPQPDWTGGWYCAAAQSSAWSSSGSKSLRLTSPLSQFGTALAAQSSSTFSVYLEPGKTYTIGATRYLPAPLTGTLGTYAGAIAVTNWDTTAEYISTALPNTAGTASVTYKVTIPPDWVYGIIHLGYGGTVYGAGDVYWDDMFIVEHAPEVDYTDGYFDGSTTGAEDIFYSWAETVNNSESIKQTTSYAKFSDAGDGIPYTNVAISYGSEMLYNQAVVSSAAGTAIADNSSSQTSYGISNIQLDTLLSTSNAVTSLAGFYVNKYGEPDYRFETVEVILEGLETTQAQQLLELDLGDVVEIQFTPNGIGSAIFKYGQISKISHSVSADTHRIVYGFNSMQRSYLVLDDSGFGQLDVNMMAF